MALLGFHFSQKYCQPLLQGVKHATVLHNQHYFYPQQKILVYCSKEENLLNGQEEKRIGWAIVQEVKITTVNQLTESDAISCGEKNLNSLKQSLQQWYQTQDNSIVTLVKFQFSPSEQD